MNSHCLQVCVQNERMWWFITDEVYFIFFTSFHASLLSRDGKVVWGETPFTVWLEDAKPIIDIGTRWKDERPEEAGRFRITQDSALLPRPGKELKRTKTAFIILSMLRNYKHWMFPTQLEGHYQHFQHRKYPEQQINVINWQWVLSLFCLKIIMIFLDFI